MAGSTSARSTRSRSPPALGPALRRALLDEDAAHGLGRRGEEVAAAVPAPGRLVADQPEVGLVDQGRGLERLARLLLRQPLGGELAQLVVDQRQELLGRLRVALLDGREDACDVVHRREPPGTSHPRSIGPHPSPVARIASQPGPGRLGISMRLTTMHAKR